MGPLTPLDAETLQFRAAMRGYDKLEVEQFRAQVMRTLEEYIDQIGRLRMRIGEMEAEVARYRETEDLVKNSVMLAQRTSEEIISAAKDRAQALIDQAHNEGESIRQQLAMLSNDREQFEYEFHSLLSGYLARLEQHNPQLGRSAEATSAPAPRAATLPKASVREQSRDQLEQVLQAAGPAPAPEPAAAPEPPAAPASPPAWNIIPSLRPAADEMAVPSAGLAPEVREERVQRLDEEPRHGTSVGDPVLFIDPQLLESRSRPAVAPADSPGSTFHAFSEPHWVDPQLQAHPPEQKRDDDIDAFTKALEQ